MAQKTPRNSTKYERAAVLVAEDEITDEDIAGQVGISRRTLSKWKQDPVFQARVREIVDSFAISFQRYRIGRRDKRMAVLDDMLARSLSIVTERAEQYAETGELGDQHISGGKSGFIVRKPTLVKVFAGAEDDPHEAGEDGELLQSMKLSAIAYEYSFDSPLWKGLLDVMRQAAQETGQWNEKRETGFDGEVEVTLVIDRRDRASGDGG